MWTVITIALAVAAFGLMVAVGALFGSALGPRARSARPRYPLHSADRLGGLSRFPPPTERPEDARETRVGGGGR